MLSSFTVDTLLPKLGVALAELGVTADITAGPFNQIVQECVDPRSETAASKPDVLVVWPRLEEFWGDRPVWRTDTASLLGGLADVVSAALAAADRLAARLVLVLPATPVDRPLGAGDATNPAGVVATAAAARERMRVAVAQAAGTVLCDADETMRMIGESAAYDHRLDVLFRIPYTERYLVSMAQALSRSVTLVTRPARRAIVVDADNTLWGGVVGEVGAAGIDLGPGQGEAYLAFQEHLLGLRANGVLLALCGRNLEQDVWQAFSRREMRLSREHLSAWRIGWRPRHEVIKEIADELQVAVDEMVFVGDSHAELSAAEAALPGLTTVAMPTDVVRWREAANTPVLDWLPPTGDDPVRSDRIREDRYREQPRQIVTPEVYLKDVDIRVEISRPEPADYRCLAQLVLKANQMRINGEQPSERRLAELCESPDYEVRLFAVGDRFDDHGQVGAYVLELGATGVARLGLFVMSSRVLGRGVEQVMVADAFDVAGRYGIEKILATVEERARNEPARRFFTSIGCRAGVESTLDNVGFPSYLTVRETGTRRG